MIEIEKNEQPAGPFGDSGDERQNAVVARQPGVTFPARPG